MVVVVVTEPRCCLPFVFRLSSVFVVHVLPIAKEIAQKRIRAIDGSGKQIHLNIEKGSIERTVRLREQLERSNKMKGTFNFGGGGGVYCVVTDV